jgi:formylglycine-generating enzyme required for sulfatase activity
VEKKPLWPVALGLGALVVIGGGGGLVWWKRSARPAAKTASSTSLGAAANGKLAAHRGTCAEGYVFVPAGTFTMGSPDGEGKADEHPAHAVQLAGFCIGGTEVTVAQFRECVNEKRGDLQCTAPKPAKGCNWNNPARAKHPINCVDWTQADTFCKWAGGALPNEAQWEYAARGTDGRKYPWGNDAPNAKLLNACGAECGDARPGRKSMYDKSDRFVETAPVGSYPDGASPFGALDMAGNVFEWVSDRYEAYPGGAPLPKEADAPDGGAPPPSYTIRGGSYTSVDLGRVRVTARQGSISTGMVGTGFRCVRNP